MGLTFPSPLVATVGVATLQIWSDVMTYERLLVSKKELKALGIPYSFQHIARLEKAGKFPKRIMLGQCRVAWLYKEVCEWIEERVAQRDLSHRR